MAAQIGGMLVRPNPVPRTNNPTPRAGSVSVFALSNANSSGPQGPARDPEYPAGEQMERDERLSAALPAVAREAWSSRPRAGALPSFGSHRRFTHDDSVTGFHEEPTQGRKQHHCRANAQSGIPSPA